MLPCPRVPQLAGLGCLLAHPSLTPPSPLPPNSKQRKLCRRQGASDSGGGHSPKFVPRDTTPEPSHHLPLFLVSPGGGGAGGRMGRSPSSDWDSSGYFGLPYDDSAAVEGAVTLLAAAAEVEEQAAAAAAAAAAGASAGEGVSLGGPGSANGCGAESASAASGGTSAPAAAVTAPAPTAQLVLPAMAAATAPTTPAAKADGAVLAPAPVLLPAGLVALAQGESAGVPPAQFEAVWGRLQAEAQHKVVVLRLLAALAAASTGHAA